MKSERGITLIVVIITVMLLSIIGGLAVTNGMDSYRKTKVIKFQTYMRTIQKKVDIIVEENIGKSNYYQAIGEALTTEQKQRLQNAINNGQMIETSDVNAETLRYFSSNTIKTEFGIDDIEDEIVVNFANREVISLNGIEKNGTMHYVEYSMN